MEKRGWLLINEKDEEARPGSGDAVVRESLGSVVSGRDLEAIAGASPAPLPKAFRPQLATLMPEAPGGASWIHEIKLDGYRILCFLEEGRARLVTRNGKDWTGRFPAIAEALSALPCRAALIDGEAAVLDRSGRSDFQLLQNSLGGADRVHLFAFDLLHLDGHDLAAASLLDRKELLRGLLERPVPSGALRFTDHVRGEGPRFWEEACGAGLEGIISKRAEARYRPGRGTDWVKVKCLLRQEFVVVGFTDPKGSRSAFGSLLLAVHEDDRLVYAGRVGTGFTDASLGQLHERLLPLRRPTSPIADPPREARRGGVHWVEPELVAEVAFTEWTGEGRVRHPSFRGVREDKRPSEVIRELPAADPVSRGRSSAKGGFVEIAGVRLTSPDRILYPDQGITKIRLARYYESIADWVLPHLARRPLTLLRCPAGRHSSCFFQKHAGEGVPEVVPRVRVDPEDPDPYMMIDGLPSVIALVQLGVLEFHVWGSRADRLDRPDRLIFDLDPDEGLDWSAVLYGALRLRELLEALGLRTFVKGTGGKGLHVVAPLVRRSDWDEAKAFAKAVADELAREEPERFTSNMSKKKRRGRIFVDYLRNGWNATAIAAYSTRARPGAPVSVPLHWDELDRDGPPPFTMEDVPSRLDSLQEDPWADIGSVRQSITRAMREEVGLR